MTTMIGYLRVSTEEQATSGLGLEAQRDTIARYAEQHGWDVVWYEDAGYSGKDDKRPALQEALTRLHAKPSKRDVDGLLVAKLDRLSRSVHDFSGLLKLATARKWSVVAIDLGVDTSTITGKLVAQIMSAIGEWEREIIGARTSAAMQAAKRQGKQIGRAATPLPATTTERLLMLHGEGLSVARIADRLNAEGVTTALGSRWYVSTVTTALNRLTKETAASAA